MSRYLKWHRAHRAERGEATRVAVTLLAGPVFLGLLPSVVARIGPRLDRRLGLPPLPSRAACRILGGALAAAGFAVAWWTIATQLDRGRGTPLPMVPTQALLTDGPFRYCRNPMTLGTIVAYLGIGVAARTPAGIALVLLFGTSLVGYLKGFEEDELAERFGDAYEAYRRATPFLVPALRA